jgi:hypothetical protein
LTSVNTQKILTIFISTVWLINGLICKVLNLVPRHEQIVSRILNSDYSRFLTFVIGLFEIGMALWIWSGIKKRLNAITQIAIVATMNIIEFLVVPDLLLWGKLNIVFAGLFALMVFYTEFVLNKNITQQI